MGALPLRINGRQRPTALVTFPPVRPPTAAGHLAAHCTANRVKEYGAVQTLWVQHVERETSDHCRSRSSPSHLPLQWSFSLAHWPEPQARN